ncbi:Mitochondrial import inner membrane translocase subunit Tim9, partial [Lamprotornis superbus]
MEWWNMAGQISESDQIKQFKEFLGTYNKLTENCFVDCIKDFTSRDVKPEEITCSENCLQKYLKMTQRISMRFQEYHIQQNEALAAKAGLLSQPRISRFFTTNVRVYVHGSELLARQRNVYHLHSTASTFWGGEDDEGLIPVSEEADDMDAP